MDNLDELLGLRRRAREAQYFVQWKHGVTKRRPKAERAATRAGVATQMVGSAGETLLKLLSWFLRRRRVRDFLNAYVIPRIARDKMAFKEMAMAKRHIQRLAPRPKDKMIVGPWLREVGFELLYWIPSD